MRRKKPEVFGLDENGDLIGSWESLPMGWLYDRSENPQWVYFLQEHREIYQRRLLHQLLRMSLN